MPPAFTPVVLSGNDLLEGDVVWWTGAGWSRALGEASVFADEAGAAAAEAGLAGLKDVVGLARVEVSVTAAGPVPVLRREQIRADRRPTFDYLPAAFLQEAA